MTSIKSFRGRRHHLASQMHKGVAIVPTAAERVRNRDAHYPYRYDSYFYYLTGFTGHGRYDKIIFEDMWTDLHDGDS